MNRIKTGISGLDERIDGIPSGKTILLTGEPGTGKTIFGLQFAWVKAEGNRRDVLVGARMPHFAALVEIDDLVVQPPLFAFELHT